MTVGLGHSLCCSGLGLILRPILTAPTLFSMIISKQQCCLKIYYSQRDGVGREEGGGFRMGITCIPVADSF